MVTDLQAPTIAETATALADVMTPKMATAQKRHRIASIDLEIARLTHEKALLRAELTAK